MTICTYYSFLGFFWMSLTVIFKISNIKKIEKSNKTKKLKAINNIEAKSSITSKNIKSGDENDVKYKYLLTKENNLNKKNNYNTGNLIKIINNNSNNLYDNYVTYKRNSLDENLLVKNYDINNNNIHNNFNDINIKKSTKEKSAIDYIIKNKNSTVSIAMLYQNFNPNDIYNNYHQNSFSQIEYSSDEENSSDNNIDINVNHSELNLKKSKSKKKIGKSLPNLIKENLNMYDNNCLNLINEEVENEKESITINKTLSNKSDSFLKNKYKFNNKIKERNSFFNKRIKRRDKRRIVKELLSSNNSSFANNFNDKSLKNIEVYLVKENDLKYNIKKHSKTLLHNNNNNNNLSNDI